MSLSVDLVNIVSVITSRVTEVEVSSVVEMETVTAVPVYVLTDGKEMIARAQPGQTHVLLQMA